jgi:DNA-directed RNA polymerase subunit RPC12/RpoP
MAVCRSCGIELTNDNWPKSRQKSKGYQCRICNNKQSLNYYYDHHEHCLEVKRIYYKGAGKLGKRDSELRRKFGKNLLWYNEQFEKQSGKCAICGEAQQNNEMLDVDHNHRTGKVRQLLCRRCNSVIGLTRESIFVLNGVIKYLEFHNG